ncbi:MAG: restriction endonuclease subunit R [Citrobacter freundii]|nr:MAG: restriction endonuclease subunit R [Citrobacter freundii]
MPAYYYDPYHYRVHKMKGGTFQNYADKSFLPLTDDQLIKHLNGEHFIGIYPLLQDNTSWFIVADFDEGNWITIARQFIHACQENGLYAYLERSRSGNGGHAWIFFDKPIPAYKSRKVFLSLLMSSGAISAFDKNTSFDRLFPNQDQLSGKGFGNLIALPLNGTASQQGNTCFIDPSTQVAYTDQWQFLSGIKRTPAQTIEELFTKPSKNIDQPIPHGKLQITLGNNVRLNRSAISSLLFSFIKEELNFPSSAFIIQQKAGRNTFGLERYFRFIEEEGELVHLPKGFTGKLIRFCRDNQIEYDFKDDRILHQPVPFSFQATLRPHQQDCITAIDKKDMGVIVAPPGSGKTVVALKTIADKQQPALIVVHRKQLASQWMERIESFLGIPQKQIGRIGQGKSLIGKQITIATIQSLAKADLNELHNKFGLIIVDECHHIPAETFRNTIGKFNSKYLYGLTATPFRKYNDGRIIFIHLGDIIAEINAASLPSVHQPIIIIRNTDLNVPFNAKTDQFETLSKILVHDSARNRLILKDVIDELQKRRKCVILTERKEHIETLEQYLKQSFETITLSGDDAEAARKTKWKILQQGNYQVLITTGQFFGEGSDLQNAERLFLVYPFSFEGKLIQYMGRVQRSEISPTIYDYRDIHIDYLNRMFLKRNVYYRKLEKQRTLFDFPDNEKEDAPVKNQEDTIIEKVIKVKIAELEFLYGSIQFQHTLSEHPVALKFDIEQLHIRPEFEVLKPYFEKHLQAKTADVHITVVIDRQQQVTALSASSEALEQLNREVVEGIRFRFIERNFFNKKQIPDQPATAPESNLSTTNALYGSGEELLAEVLSKGNYRHQRQLHYLSENHVGTVLKIRFVLSPFSFVFLLEGNERYHLVLETLDTDEATYLWHVPKNMQELKAAIQQIDQQLTQIRNEGRQRFLETNPENFSRVVHDYSDEMKGFVVWKGAVEERLY